MLANSGEAAQKQCPELLTVLPQYKYYLKFSKLLIDIYKRYTDLIEPFGMDECWLDVSGSVKPPMQIAEEIRCAVKDELGITVSIGVSFNKVFAKLGSDMKKPDAITEISKDNFKEKVWSLPCSDIIYCVRATAPKLSMLNINTIGDLAAYPHEYLEKKLGKNGAMLWKFANGLDTSKVSHIDRLPPAKSVGHGITCVSDLETAEEAEKVIYALSQDIGYKLRLMGLKAGGVHLYIRDNKLFNKGWQSRLLTPAYDENVIAGKAFEILKDNYTWEKPVRALTVTATGLVPKAAAVQTNLFSDAEKAYKRERLCKSMDIIKERFGKKAVFPAVILNECKIPKNFGRKTRN